MRLLFLFSIPAGGGSAHSVLLLRVRAVPSLRRNGKSSCPQHRGREHQRTDLNSGPSDSQAPNQGSPGGLKWAERSLQSSRLAAGTVRWHLLSCRSDTCCNSESLGSAPELPVERRVGAGVIACSGLGLVAGEQKPASQCPQHSSHLVWMTATPAAQPEHLRLPADLCSGHFLSPNGQPAQKWNHPALHLTAEGTGTLRGLVSCPRSQSRERAVKA